MSTIGSSNLLNRVFYNELGPREIRELQNKVVQGAPSAIVNISNKAKELQAQTKNTVETIEIVKARQENFLTASEDYRNLIRQQQNSFK